jgi:hypothetical protein
MGEDFDADLEAAKEEECALAAQNVINARDEMVDKVVSLANYMRGETEDKIGVDLCMREFLTGKCVPRQGDYPEMRREMMNGGKGAAAREVARIMRILINVPVSEAGCERMGSLAEALFGKNRSSSNSDLIEAEVIIRAQQALGNVW